MTEQSNEQKDPPMDSHQPSTFRYETQEYFERGEYLLIKVVSV